LLERARAEHRVLHRQKRADLFAKGVGLVGRNDRQASFLPEQKVQPVQCFRFFRQTLSEIAPRPAVVQSTIWCGNFSHNLRAEDGQRFGCWTSCRRRWLIRSAAEVELVQ
jgi:hypothetical protein